MPNVNKSDQVGEERTIMYSISPYFSVVLNAAFFLSITTYNSGPL